MSRLFRVSLMLAFFYGIEKLLGFARQLLIARQFSLSPELDAFNTANNLPDLLFALISAGALGIAFIPVLSDALQKEGRPELWRVFSQVANFILPLTALLSVVIAIFAPQIVHAQIGIAPGFTLAQQSLVANLMRLNLIATLIFSLAGLLTAGLQANQHFFLPALAPMMYDLGMLVGVLVLAPTEPYHIGPLSLPAFGLGIYGLVYGVILGSVLFMGVQLPGLVMFRFRWVPSLGFNNPRVWRVYLLMGPRLLTVLCINLIFIIQDNLASRLATGAVTALVFGWLILQVPETLIGTALGTALLPTLSEQTARQESANFAATLNRGVRAILALTIPLTVLISLVITPVVELLGFDASGTELVAWTARLFLLGMLGHALLEIIVRGFYSRQNALIPLASAFGTVVLLTVLAIPLALWLGAPGLALANSLAFSLQAAVLLFILNRQMGRFLHVKQTFLRACAGALVGGMVCAGLFWTLGNLSFFSASLLGGLARSALAALAGGAACIPFILTDLKLMLKL